MSQHLSKDRDCRIEAPLLSVSLNACKNFIKTLQKKRIQPKSLDIFRNPNVLGEIDHLSSNLLEDIYTDIRKPLQDESCGIVALDIPQEITHNPTLDTLFGAIIAQTIVNRIMPPAIDRRNQTPFTLYNASKSNEDKLKKAGLKFYSPEEKLGFHTDGRIDSPDVYIPDFLSIYNLLIAYKETGNFYWIPFTLWNEFESHAEAIGWNKPYKFELTPIIYPGENGTVEALPKTTIEAPIFNKKKNHKSMFFNGQIIGRNSHEDDDVLTISKSLTSSMQSNPVRYHVPQYPRRLMIMKNSTGAHSRDIFNSPLTGTRYTRSFMRSVSLEGEKVGTVC